MYDDMVLYDVLSGRLSLLLLVSVYSISYIPDLHNLEQNTMLSYSLCSNLLQIDCVWLGRTLSGKIFSHSKFHVLNLMLLKV
jgi:hypothetical protein